jgi:hypothetical protein
MQNRLGVAWDWVVLARDMGTLRAFVNAVVNIGFHTLRGIFWLMRNC